LAKIFGRSFHDGSIVDTGSLRMNADRTISVTLTRRGRLTEWKERTKHLVNWFDNNIAEGFDRGARMEAGEAVAAFGSVAKGRYTENDLKRLLEIYLAQTCKFTTRIRHISMKPHVTTVFNDDMNTALALTTEAIELVTEAGTFTVKYNLNLATKSRATHIKIADLPEKIMTGLVVKTKLNQVLGVQGKMWTFIHVEMLKNASGQQLDYLYAYPQQGVEMKEILKALENFTLFQKKVKVLDSKDRGQKGVTPQGTQARGGRIPTQAMPPPASN